MSDLSERVLGELSGLEMFEKAGRPVYMHINLDAIVHNAKLFRNMCSNPKVGVLAVLKANSSGYGAVQVGRHLRDTGAAERLGVATTLEGIQLREAGIQCPIHVLGNVQSWEMASCVKHSLIPSVSEVKVVLGMAKALKEAGSKFENNHHMDAWKPNLEHAPLGAIHILLDTGLGRNGCQPSQLDSIVQACDVHGVPLEGIFSHIGHVHDQTYTANQIKLFDESIAPYKERDLLFHMASSEPVMKYKECHKYPMIRSTTAIMGQPGSAVNAHIAASRGFKPPMEVKACPTLVKFCEAGTLIGYKCMYRCDQDEWIATFSIGYGDGYWRELSLQEQCIRRDKTGELCPVVGLVSMDAITVRLPCQPDEDEIFTIITADYGPDTSVVAISRRVNTTPAEVMVRLAARLPRVYTSVQKSSIEVVRP